jgi:hypothetical protein
MTEVKQPEEQDARGVGITMTPDPIAVRLTVSTPRIAMRSYFSTHHLWTAIRHAHEARTIEASHAGRSQFDRAHRSYVLSSILSSVAYLEGMVNELFEDADDGHGLTGDGYLSPLTTDVQRAMGAFWATNKKNRRLSIVDKYQQLVGCAGLPRMDAGKAPIQDVTLVIKLRNALVHYTPEHVAADVAHELDALRPRFDANPLMVGTGNAWWPDHCLGAGCADWAHQSVTALADTVAERLGIQPNYMRLRDRGWDGQPPAVLAAP